MSSQESLQAFLYRGLTATKRVARMVESFLDFPDLGDIILDRWDNFEDLFGDRRAPSHLSNRVIPLWKRALEYRPNRTVFEP